MPNPIHIIFDKLPGPDAPRFIEVEDGNGNYISVGEWREREDGTAELVIPVAQEREAVGVAIKPLEWRGPDVNSELHASCLLGTYTIRANLGSLGYWLTQVGGYHPSVDAAKAAAQADYEQRIRSALVSPPVEAQPAKGVREGRTAIDVIDTLLESLQEGLMTDADLTEDDRVAMQHQINALDTAKEEIEALATLEPTAPEEPFAWYLTDIQGRMSLASDSRADADAWREQGYTVKPLYASSPATASGVSEEMATALKRAEAALRPFADKVFNDNGDLTVNTLVTHGEIADAYFAHKRVKAALNLGREG